MTALTSSKDVDKMNFPRMKNIHWTKSLRNSSYHNGILEYNCLSLKQKCLTLKFNHLFRQTKTKKMPKIYVGP